MTRTAKRIRSIAITVVAIGLVNSALAFAGSRTGIAAIPDVPRPKTGIAAIPDVPRPKTGIAAIPDVPRP